MRDWVKIIGSTERPYTQAAHDRWDQTVVEFPSRQVKVQRGDRLLLYTGHPLRRFIGVCRVRETPQPLTASEDGLASSCSVFAQLCLEDIETYGVPSNEVFPLPSGQKLLALRQKSHVQVRRLDAHHLIGHLLRALTRELEDQTDALLQRCLFSN